MYTVQSAYTRTLEEADKLGSDYFSLPQFLNAFKHVTLDFVGARAKEAEKTETVTNDIRSLVKQAILPFTDNPDFPSQKIAGVPVDLHTRLSINVIYSDQMQARKPTIERFGEANANNINPNKKPSKYYPVIQNFSNYYNVITGIPVGSPVVPDKLKIIYIKYPAFGLLATQVVVDLPDAVCEELFAKAATHFRINNGDPGAQMNFQVDSTYRDNK